MANDSIFEGLDPEVAAVLNDARRTSPVALDAGLIASMAAAVVNASLIHQPALPRRKTMIGKLITGKVLGIVGALALTGGAAAAATGTLPDPVQDTASHAAEHLGVHIPEGNQGANVSSEDGTNNDQNVSDTANDNNAENDNVNDSENGTVNDGPNDNVNHGDTTDTTAVGDHHGSDNGKGSSTNGHDGTNDPANHDATSDSGNG